MRKSNIPTDSTDTGQELTDADKMHIRRLQVLRRTGAVNMFMDLRRGLHLVLDEDAAEATFEWVQGNIQYYLNGDWVRVSVTDDSDAHDEAYLHEDERATDEVVGSIMEDLTRDEMRQITDIKRDDPEWLPEIAPSDYNVLVDECRYELRQGDCDSNGDAGGDGGAS